jgi:predicted transposase
VIRIIRLKLMLDEGQKVSLLRTMEAYTRAFDYST